MKTNIGAAHERIAGFVRQTPLLRLEPGALGVNAELFLKLENLQVSGSFKIRGAINTVLSYPNEARGGLIAASGGNHGLAVAFIARRMKLPARIFVPSITSQAKRDLLRDLGAEVIEAGHNYSEARAAAQMYLASYDGLMIDAFESAQTLAGQGTIGPELENLDLDAIALSVGGGGLAAGIAGWFESKVRLICGEPRLAPTLHAAVVAGQPVDVETACLAADALGCRRIGDLAFAQLARSRMRTVLVTEEAIREAQRDLWATARLAVEPAAAVPIAALRAMQPEEIEGQRIAVILCGANVHPSEIF